MNHTTIAGASHLGSPWGERYYRHELVMYCKLTRTRPAGEVLIDDAAELLLTEYANPLSKAIPPSMSSVKPDPIGAFVAPLTNTLNGITACQIGTVAVVTAAVVS